MASILNDSHLRAIGWSQVNFIFGCNPAGTHLSNKSGARVALGGYWAGVERGWPFQYVHGAGELGYTRGTLDGSPTNHAFPFNPDSAALSDSPDIYGTEGWAISNRGWMATLTFSTTGSHAVSIINSSGRKIVEARTGETVMLQLMAALNTDWKKREQGWVLVKLDDKKPAKVWLTETGVNTGVFTAAYKVPAGTRLTASYGYLGFEKVATLTIK